MKKSENVSLNRRDFEPKNMWHSWLVQPTTPLALQGSINVSRALCGPRTKYSADVVRPVAATKACIRSVFRSSQSIGGEKETERWVTALRNAAIEFKKPKRARPPKRAKAEKAQDAPSS